MSDSPNEMRRLVVSSNDVGVRLDRFLSAHLEDLSRQRLKALILEGYVTVDRVLARNPAQKVHLGWEISAEVPPPVDALPRPEKIALDVVFEDAHLIVVDKAPGLVVHPAPGHETGTLVNALIEHCGGELSGIGGVRRPGIVHRLDKDTSGLLVVAKSDAAHQGLARQFQAHGADGRLQRAYLALSWGHLDRPDGRIDAAIARSSINRRKMAIAKPEMGRHAATRYRVMQKFGSTGSAEVSLLRLELETGRTHQIRVHLASIAHPLLGDRLYGAGFKSSEANLPEPAQAALHRLNRQALHATLLGFEHPTTGEPLAFERPLPLDMQALVEQLSPS